MKPACGIYMIENKKTGEKYIGQSVNCQQRFSEHCSRNSLLIDQAIHILGRENFNFFIIHRCKKSSLTYWEQFYIYKYKAFENGYNEKVIEAYQKRFRDMEKQTA